MKGVKGFTFFEVLVAMVIFTLAALSAASIIKGAVANTVRAKEITVASWLLQNIMTELETRLETEGLEAGCEKKQEGKFPEPYENYTWFATCLEIDFQLSQTAAGIGEEQLEEAQEDESNVQSEDLILKNILGIANQYLSDSVREVHAVVSWPGRNTERTISATTHFARYDLPLQTGLGGGSGGGETGGTGDGGSGTGQGTGGGTGQPAGTGGGSP